MRTEFSKKTKAQIVLRATDANGRVICEGCGLVLGHKPYHIDHVLEEGLRLEKRTLTAEDGQLLGVDCCHKPKTRERTRMIRKADRQRNQYRGIKSSGRKIQSPGFAKGNTKPALWTKVNNDH